MSNGTRIDPEEREPRAIKIRQPKHTGRKIAIGVTAAAIVIAAGVFSFIKFGPEISLPKIELPSFDFEFKKAEKREEIIEEPEESVTEEPTVEEPVVEEPVVEEEPEETVTEEPVIEEPVVEEPAIPKDEWYMILVNRENSLPEDYSINFVIIDEASHTADERINFDLFDMLAAAEADGVQLAFYTAYRTVERQNELFAAGKTDVPGGCSEHNTGLALDIGCAFGEFVGSPEQNWLLEHAYEYGFILRYPEGKEEITGFAHEPWHYRYVGKEQAKLIFESGLCLEEYLAQ